MVTGGTSLGRFLATGASRRRLLPPSLPIAAESLYDAPQSRKLIWIKISKLFGRAAAKKIPKRFAAASKLSMQNR
jgi:hypothetical protein